MHAHAAAHDKLLKLLLLDFLLCGATASTDAVSQQHSKDAIQWERTLHQLSAHHKVDQVGLDPLKAAPEAAHLVVQLLRVLGVVLDVPVATKIVAVGTMARTMRKQHVA